MKIVHAPVSKRPLWKSAFTSPLFAVILLVSSGGYVHAADDGKPFTSTILNLADFDGTFYEFMEAKNGLHQALNADLNEPIKLVELKKIKEIAKTQFDPNVFKKILAFLNGGETGFDKLFTKLEADIKGGKVVTMDNIAQELRSIMSSEKLLKDATKGGLAPLVIAPLVMMGSGGGTTVVIDKDNFFLNYAYKLGPDDPGADEIIKAIMAKDGVSRAEATKTLEAAALKSGRNFGYSGAEKLLDFSDTYLLKKFDKWVDGATAEEAGKAWGVIFDLMTNTKEGSKGLKTLTNESQSLVTGWLTVYTAELRRHTMVRMANSAHPWENDLTEALMAGVFVKKNGGYMFADKSVREARKAKTIPLFVAGKPENFFGIGTQGSGIGVNRMERRGLQSLMTDALENSNPDEVAEIRKLIDVKDGDIFRGLMEFINNPKNQSAVKESRERLRKAFVDVMDILHDEKKSKKMLNYFADVGAAVPVLKKKFVAEICGSYLKP